MELTAFLISHTTIAVFASDDILAAQRTGADSLHKKANIGIVLRGTVRTVKDLRDLSLGQLHAVLHRDLAAETPEGKPVPECFTRKELLAALILCAAAVAAIICFALGIIKL